MHARHYSPRTKLLLVANGELPDQGKGIYLRFGRAAGTSSNSPKKANVKAIHMPESAEDYAAALYDELHRADEANADWIAVERPPATAEWEAINDRLRRAATHK